LDIRVRVVTVLAIFVLQLLLSFATWIASEYAMEPARLWARDLRSRMSDALASETVRPIGAIPPVMPQVPAAVPPVVLQFAAMPAPVAPLPEVPPPRLSRNACAALIRETALRHDVPPALVEAIVRVESDFNARAVSVKGARGLMQVMPDTAARFGVRNPDHLFQPRRNLAAGTAYLAWLLKRFDGNLDLTLAAYNAGERAVEIHGGIPPYRETREYVRRVRKALEL